jgi:hypothetical protein
MIRTSLFCTGIFLATLGPAWSQIAAGPQSNSLVAIAPGEPNANAEQAPVLTNECPDRLFDLPPLKDSGSSLMGGVLESIDRVRDRLVLRPFGRGKLTIAFDPRTRFLRDTEGARAQDMRPGDRVYVETVLDGTTIFAKTVHLPTEASVGSVQGQIISYDAAQGSLSISDQLSTQAVKFRVTSKTIVTGAGLSPGALVQLNFLPGEAPPAVREIRVLIAPGSVFTFSGRITFLDLAAQELVLASATDNNRYEIQLNPALVDADSVARLSEGASVTIVARFNGQAYAAESVTVLAHPKE